MYCNKCGKLINDDSLFCRFCGEKQENSYSTSKDMIKSITCPNCGGKLSINKDCRVVTCSYCNHSIYFNDGVIRKESYSQSEHKRYVYDEAEVVRAKNKDAKYKRIHEEKMLELQIMEDDRRRRHILAIVAIIAILLAVIVCYIFRREIAEFFSFIIPYLIAAFIIIILAIVAIKSRDSRTKETCVLVIFLILIFSGVFSAF